MDSEMQTIDMNTAITGTSRLFPGDIKPGIDLGDLDTRSLIDAPIWVPTGSHELYETQGRGWTISNIFGEHVRPGAWS
jgi:hypothetical protein